MIDRRRIKRNITLTIVLFTLVSVVVVSAYGKTTKDVENYSSVHGYLETDALILHDNLGAQEYALSYVPEYGWLFIVKNYGQYNFQKVSSAIQRSFESVELLIIQDRLDPDTKFTVALKLDIAADLFITFKAKNLQDTDKWTIYRGNR